MTLVPGASGGGTGNPGGGAVPPPTVASPLSAPPPSGPPAGAGTAPPSPAPVGDPGANVPGTLPPPPAWLTGVPEELQTYALSKGFPDTAAALKAYQHAEKRLGHRPEDLAVIPKDHDLEGRAAIMKKLGVPETPDGYKLTPSQNATQEEKETLGRLAGWFHENKVTPWQAKGLLQKVTEFSQAEQKRQTDAQALAVETDFQGLKKDWGQAYQANVQIGKQALQRALDSGVFPSGENGLAQLDQIEKSIGFGPLLRLMHWVGSKSVEPDFISPPAGGGAPSFAVLGPQQAKGAIEEMLSSKDIMARVRTKGTTENRRWSELHQVAYPG